MQRAFLPKALALTVLTAGLTFAGAQQTQPAPDASAPPQNAPSHHRHTPNPQHQAEFLTKKLNLTPDQTAKIEPILADRDQKMQALHANGQLTETDRHQQMRAINESSQQQMANILTADQMTQLKAMHHEHHGHHGGDDRPADNGQSPS